VKRFTDLDQANAAPSSATLERAIREDDVPERARFRISVRQEA
jgi:hypothetical protein